MIKYADFPFIAHYIYVIRAASLSPTLSADYQQQTLPAENLIIYVNKYTTTYLTFKHSYHPSPLHFQFTNLPTRAYIEQNLYTTGAQNTLGRRARREDVFLARLRARPGYLARQDSAQCHRCVRSLARARANVYDGFHGCRVRLYIYTAVVAALRSARFPSSLASECFLR